ncbi:MAG TPA: hypothetical protein VFD84_18720 [Candidatus Binatia bacterium]|jgi:hypothetical protein|nr:hypothetical protein [Candidatus Binatia bacterium]
MSTPISQTMTSAARGTDAGDRRQECGPGAKGGEPVADLRFHGADRRVERFDVLEMEVEEDALMARETAAQRRAERGRARLDAASGDGGELVGIGLGQVPFFV